jgi:RHS repeat-associated protein
MRSTFTTARGGFRRWLTTRARARASECSVTNFVYGPDYVDEFVCQIIQPTLTQPPTQTHYYLQDDNYNVVGLVSTAGEVVQQYVHSPYGRPLIAESFGPQTFTNTVGHQGLFAYAYDGSGDPLAAGTSGTPIFCYNRNRVYLPHLGRFAQADMNASGTLISMGALSRIGDIDPDALYGDGMCLYAYLASSPLRHVDPSGLSAEEPLHHLYPKYLGGSPTGPGIRLTYEQHTEIHSYLKHVWGVK